MQAVILAKKDLVLSKLEYYFDEIQINLKKSENFNLISLKWF